MVLNGYYHVADLLFGGRLKKPSRRESRSFRSAEEKFERLMKMCDGSRITGCTAREMLRIDGDRPIVWIDIDTKNSRVVDEWIRSKRFPFVEGSYSRIKSTTGNCHMYVVLDREPTNDECMRLYEIVIDTMDEFSLVEAFDRLVGPSSEQVIYFPNGTTGNPIPPQHLVRDLPNVNALDALLALPSPLR